MIIMLKLKIQHLPVILKQKIKNYIIIIIYIYIYNK